MTQTTTKPTIRGPAGRPAQSAQAPLEGRRDAAALRSLGALALLAVGAVHLEQYLAYDMRSVSVIGPLFLLNFAGATALVVVLLVPLRGRGAVLRRLAAGGGIGLALTSIVFLLISEYRTLFGFMEEGYRPAVVVALVAEGAAAVLLTAYLAVYMRGR
jgi:hypothetical protein